MFKTSAMDYAVTLKPPVAAAPWRIVVAVLRSRLVVISIIPILTGV